MTEAPKSMSNLDHLRRIATAQAARPRVDANGRPIGKPSTFTYDDRGFLVRAEVAQPETSFDASTATDAERAAYAAGLAARGQSPDQTA